MPATASNRGSLEEYIKDWYASSAFNVCKRQAWPRTAGPAMKIFTKPDATPVCITKPAPVHLHFRKEVKAGLDADLAKGVLERVTISTQDTWCMRMVITPKKDGTPRRTIDLSAITRAGIRQTHHTRSATKIARSVPVNKLKSTLDCVYGYHGVELAQEDRHKTTFITEWGKYCYKRTPQGYGSSEDGFTIWTDDILDDCLDRPDDVDLEKLIDDILQWCDTIEQAFFQICNLLRSSLLPEKKSSLQALYSAMLVSTPKRSICRLSRHSPCLETSTIYGAALA